MPFAALMIASGPLHAQSTSERASSGGKPISGMSPEKLTSGHALSQFMGEQSPGSLRAGGDHGTTIEELEVSPEEKTGLLQMGTDPCSRSRIFRGATRGFELPTPAPAPDLQIQDARVAMETPTPPSPRRGRAARGSRSRTCFRRDRHDHCIRNHFDHDADPDRAHVWRGLTENWYFEWVGSHGPFTPRDPARHRTQGVPARQPDELLA